MNAEVAQILEFQTADSPSSAAPVRGRLVAIESDGMLRVRVAGEQDLRCAWLETGAKIELAVGDVLLVLPPTDEPLGVVLGRIGRYQAPQPAAPEAHVTIEASETLVLKCGEASVDLRADGKVMIRGDDMLLRAKGTQRIKAGSVNIN